LATHTYEAMFLLDSTKTAASWDESEKQVHEILKKHNAEIVASRQWDDRRLAQPVKGHKKGTYLLTFFKSDATQLKEIVSDCHLSELILRELIQKIHPKLVEHLINQAMNFTPGQDEENVRPEEEDDRPRRRRRDE
jgi:small subunit ribosomal protein S6